MLKEKQSKCSKMTWRPQDFKKLLHVILATQEAGIRRIVVPSQPANSLRDPISKTPITKKSGRRLVEYLKVKALSSSPSTEKKVLHSKLAVQVQGC
jgi:hypothetical protein